MSGDYAFRDRPPTDEELRKLVLALSTYRDGSGQQLAKGRTQPGWRDFERATASALDAECPENKGVFDVLVPVESGLPFGLSLKTSAMRSGFVLMELHNSNAKAWAWLNERGIDPKSDPKAAGDALVEQVKSWHDEMSAEVDVGNSSYLVLTHDRAWQQFQLSWFSMAINVPVPKSMQWQSTGRRIYATHEDHQYWEWYGESGGQLKYYPRLTDARWVSPPFELLDPPSEETPIAKAKRYWPDAFA